MVLAPHCGSRETRMAQGIEERRYWLRAAGVTAMALVGCGRSGHEPEEVEVTPGEDLMQEHGILERLLLGLGDLASFTP